ncbi:MAG: ATP-dependent helicase [Rhodoferax sp.]|nr:ATP-dependent helicase [Rhodoferax sp.]
MLADLSVSPDDFAYAERTLLPAGESFDEERRRFIRNMGTLDLLAVPGSGKTTALLAKLLILDRQPPRRNGAGILVISHTNAAIDEIRNRIGPHCTQLFRYPNFVGTIQRFVDEFLAIPYYISWYRKAPMSIDDTVHDRRFADPPFRIKAFTDRENKNARWFLKANMKRLRWSWVDDKAVLTDGYGGKTIEFRKPRGNTKPQNYSDWNASERARVGAWVRAFKLVMLKAGYLSYDDAYFLALVALSKNGLLKLLLQKRFAFAFVDEMQDMERHQYELLEGIFFDAGASQVGYQRIGDKNQSIFDGRPSAATEFWRNREVTLELNGSYRLGPMLAGVVSTFAVSPIRIDGRGTNCDGSSVMIKPRIMVYSDATRPVVIQRFASIVRELANANLLPLTEKTRCKAVGWTTKAEANKTRLSDYYPQYARGTPRGRVERTTLASDLAISAMSVNSFGPIEKSIVDALLWVLQLENAKDPAGRPFVRQSLREFMMNEHPNEWQSYQTNIYRWCLRIAEGKLGEALQDIRQQLPAFCSQFGRNVEASKNFVFGGLEDVPAAFETTSPQVERNVLTHDGVRVEVATVHRVKGETHTATLYLETFYEKCGGGSYESERLASQFQGQPLNDKMHDLVRQSAKMIYVGFSRPTHLLCFAMHESRFEKIEAHICLNTWDIVRL